MIVTQDYGWSQLALRAGLAWPQATDWAMGQAVQAGFTGWEPFVASPTDMTRIAALAASNGLTLPSVFVCGPLHDPALSAATLATLTDIARIAADHGAGLVMIYPAQADKSDSQLAHQAAMLTTLATLLRPFGQTLCYHPEEPEMRHAAREFHHMLVATDPSLVRLCLDPDTIWRGAGHSLLAVLDIIRLYGTRIAALHLRQSHAGIWAETLGPGDIDHPQIAAALADAGAQPLIVVEHAYHPQTPATLDPVTAHRASLRYAAATFAAVAPPADRLKSG